MTHPSTDLQHRTDHRPQPSPGRRRPVVEGTVLGVGVLLAAVLVAMVNYLAARHYARFDWTASKVYSLSEKSLAVLEKVDRDIDAVMFLTPQSEVDNQVFDQVSELLDRYQAANPRIKKRVIDPARDRLEASRMIQDFSIERANAVVLAAGEDRRVIDGYDFVEYDYSGASLGQGPKVKAFKGEQLITSAILELMEERKPKVLFTTGHGEASIEDGDVRALAAAKKLLGRDNFDLETWSSIGQETVPAGTDLLVIAGPDGRFLEPETAAIERFLDAGGRALMLLDPVLREDDALGDLGLDALLARHGVVLGRDLVIDPAQRLPVYGPETIFTDAYGDHPIVAPLAGRPVILPIVRSVRRAAEVPAGVSVDALVRSSDQAWAETDLSTLPNVARSEGELGGSLSLGIAASWPATPEPEAATAASAEPGDGENPVSGDRANPVPAATAPAEDAGSRAPSSAENPTPEARLVVLGDSDFASDEQIWNGVNGDLLLAAFNWLIERDSLVSIPPREPEQIKLLLSASELRTMILLAMLVLPGAALGAGIMVHMRRRR